MTGGGVVDVVARQIFSVDPRLLHRWADEIEDIRRQLDAVAEQLRTVLRDLGQAWWSAAGTPTATTVVPGQLLAMLETLRACLDAGPLRRAAEAVTSGRRRIEQLRSERERHDPGSPAALDLDRQADEVRRQVSGTLVDSGRAVPELPLRTATGEVLVGAGPPPPPSTARTFSLYADLGEVPELNLPDPGSGGPSGHPQAGGGGGGAPFMPMMPVGGMGMAGAGVVGLSQIRSAQQQGASNAAAVGTTDGTVWRDIPNAWDVIGRRLAAAALPDLDKYDQRRENRG
jgi:hypothetical protein